MKKSLLSVAFATSIIMSVKTINGQEGFQLGVQGIPQMSWLHNQDDRDNANFEYLNTFNAAFGLSSQYGFTENVAVGLNALYSLQGQRYKFNDTERIKKLEYVKIPVLFIYNYGINDNLVFTGQIGPQFGLLTNAKLTDKDGSNILGDHKKAYENYDIAGVIAAGIGLKLSEYLFLDASARFDYGFTDAENKDYKTNINSPADGAVVSTGRADTYNSTCGLIIGIRYLFQ